MKTLDFSWIVKTKIYKPLTFFICKFPFSYIIIIFSLNSFSSRFFFYWTILYFCTVPLCFTLSFQFRCNFVMFCEIFDLATIHPVCVFGTGLTTQFLVSVLYLCFIFYTSWFVFLSRMVIDHKDFFDRIFYPVFVISVSVLSFCDRSKYLLDLNITFIYVIYGDRPLYVLFQSRKVSSWKYKTYIGPSFVLFCWVFYKMDLSTFVVWSE